MLIPLVKPKPTTVQHHQICDRALIPCRFTPSGRLPTGDRAAPAAHTAAPSPPSAGTCSPSPATPSATGRSPAHSSPSRAPVGSALSSPPSASSLGHPVVQPRVEVCQIRRWLGFGRRSPPKLAYCSTPMHSHGIGFNRWPWEGCLTGVLFRDAGVPRLLASVSASRVMRG